MFSIYKVTDQGAKTRSHLLTILHQQDGLTRNEIVQASEGRLSYEQVRRQTENLIFEREICSLRENGQRRYYLRQKFNHSLSSLSLVILVLWSVPVVNPLSSTTGNDSTPISTNPSLHDRSI